MITEDYILKLIRRAVEFITKALGLAKEGDFLTSERTLDNALLDLTGLSLDTLKSINPETLKNMMVGNDAAVFVLAEFLQVIAEVEKMKGDLNLCFLYLKKSLELYLMIHVNDDLETEKPIVDIYEQVKGLIHEKELMERLHRFFEKPKITKNTIYNEEGDA